MARAPTLVSKQPRTDDPEHLLPTSDGVRRLACTITLPSSNRHRRHEGRCVHSAFQTAHAACADYGMLTILWTDGTRGALPSSFRPRHILRRMRTML